MGAAVVVAATATTATAAAATASTTAAAARGGRGAGGDALLRAFELVGRVVAEPPHGRRHEDRDEREHQCVLDQRRPPVATTASR